MLPLHHGYADSDLRPEDNSPILHDLMPRMLVKMLLMRGHLFFFAFALADCLGSANLPPFAYLAHLPAHAGMIVLLLDSGIREPMYTIYI